MAQQKQAAGRTHSKIVVVLVLGSLPNGFNLGLFAIAYVFN